MRVELRDEARADLEGIPLLEISEDVDPLAESLIAGVPLPEKHRSMPCILPLRQSTA